MSDAYAGLAPGALCVIIAPNDAERKEAIERWLRSQANAGHMGILVDANDDLTPFVEAGIRHLAIDNLQPAHAPHRALIDQTRLLFEDGTVETLILASHDTTLLDTLTSTEEIRILHEA
ncbi:hypothetical protein [Microbacterium sp. YY-01]|uniref:hypothetical protein n=1 Tax=Microbacterium sp. YY-01 TaxID=3421634 RepID=UPI003D1810DF